MQRLAEMFNQQENRFEYITGNIPAHYLVPEIHLKSIFQDHLGIDWQTVTLNPTERYIRFKERMVTSMHMAGRLFYDVLIPALNPFAMMRKFKLIQDMKADSLKRWDNADF